MNKKMFHPLIVIAIVLGGVTPTIAQPGKITAREVVAAIQKHVGEEWRQAEALERDDVQVLLVGETREWETVEYAADAVTQGRQKALIVIGHIPSEQNGMEECTRWLRAFVKQVPLEFVLAKQPFWTVSQKR